MFSYFDLKTEILSSEDRIRDYNYELYSSNYKQLDYYITTLERLDFYYNDKEVKLTPLDGYYRNDDYYCVWTKDRTEEDINSTDYHEVCHELISKDPIHFCS